MINSGGQAYQAASEYLGSLLSKGLKGSKFNLGAGFKGAGGIEGAAGAASDIIGFLLPQKSEYAGEKGNITAGMDKAYNTISDAVAVIPGLGTAASAIMKGGALLGKGVNALGGGTDGMCVCAGTLIYTKTGKLVPIEELKQSDGILGWNPSTKQIVPQEITNVITPIEKECIKIVLEDGSYLQCSIDHPILSNLKEKAESHHINGKRIAYRNWEFRRADTLKVDNWVGKANNIDFWGDIELPQAYLVGILIGDGTYGKGSSCRIFSADPDTWKYIEENNLGVINHCDDNRPEKYSKEVRTYRIINGMELMRSLGLVYQTHENKTLPKDIFKYTKNSICKLIAGLFDTDGSVSVNTDKSQYSITLYQSNKSLLEEVQAQLYKLGIKSTISTRKATQYKIRGRICDSKVSYRLNVHDYRSVQNFYKLIPLNISYKKETLEKIYKLSLTKKIKEHSNLSGASQIKIIDIIPLGKQTVYNLTCTPNHTYIANNIITHNTTTDAILGSSFLNLTPMGLINGFGGKKAHKITSDMKQRQAFETVGGSYSGSVLNYANASKYSGKKYGAFSRHARKKANRKIDEANRQVKVMKNISQEAQLDSMLGNGMQDINNMKYQMDLQGGYNPYTSIGRRGLRLPTKKELDRSRRISSNIKNKQTIKNKFFIPNNFSYTYQLGDQIEVPEEQVKVFKNGGQMSIIPEGALHARKNNMNVENITKKGIPVVDNEGTQQAEIERNEIIFSKEATTKLEELMNDGSDQAAIEAGKLLVKEITTNLDDKTGLTKEVILKNQNGGNLNQILGGTANPTGSIIQQPTIQIPNTQEITSKMKPITDKINQDNLENFQNKQAQTKSLIGAGFQAAQGIMEGFSQAKQVKQQYNQKVEAEKQKIFSQVGTNKLQFAQEGTKLPYEEWVKTVPKDRLSDNYDLELAYKYYPLEMLEAWRTSSIKDLMDGKNHLGSVVELPNGDYEFVKLGTEETNPEVHFETDTYRDGSNGLKETHNLVFKDGRYWYIKKTPKKENGGVLDISKLSNEEKDTLLQLLLNKMG